MASALAVGTTVRIASYNACVDQQPDHSRLEGIIDGIVTLLLRVDVLLVQGWFYYGDDCNQKVGTLHRETQAHHTVSDAPPVCLLAHASNIHVAEEMLRKRLDEVKCPHVILHNQNYMCLANLPGTHPPCQQYTAEHRSQLSS
jgi:hypothetical protein